jgi:hypothetical protein
MVPYQRLRVSGQYQLKFPFIFAIITVHQPLYEDNAGETAQAITTNKDTKGA